MKKTSHVIAAAILLATGNAFSQQSVTVTEKHYVGWNADNLEYNKQALILGDKNTYGVNLCLQKPGKNGETVFYMLLTEPRRQGGFGQHSCRFLDMEVNRIPLSKLVPNDKTFHLRTEKDSAGAQLTFNFDGTKILLDTCMKKDSPLLYLKFRPAPDMPEPVRSAKIRIHVQVSGVNGSDQLKDTFAATAGRELTGRAWKEALNPLTPEDRWLILGDKVFDGSGKGKGFGPSFILLPEDFTQMKKAELRLPNQVLATLEFDLKPDFKEVTVGIWQNQSAISNADFMKLFEKNKAEFIRF